MDSSGRRLIYDHLISEVAAEFPGSVSVIDYGRILSPRGVYTEYLDGVQVRTPDGIHTPAYAPGNVFVGNSTEAAAQGFYNWLSPRIWPLIIDSNLSPSAAPLAGPAQCAIPGGRPMTDSGPAVQPGPKFPPRPSATGKERITALDGLRAVALLIIMGYHFGVGWLQGGFFSLDIFYVLSGYLITGLLVSEYRKRSAIKLSAFWLRRARRLLPALLIVLVAVTLMVRFAEPAGLYPDFRLSALSALFYFSNWWQIATSGNYFAATGPVSPLTHTWSLAVEEQFYLIWPLVVLAVMHLSRNFVRGIRVLLVLSVAGAVASAVEMALLYHPTANTTRLYFGTDTHAQSILVGSVLACSMTMIQMRRGNEGMAPTASSRLCSLAVWFSSGSPGLPGPSRSPTRSGAPPRSTTGAGSCFRPCRRRPSSPPRCAYPAARSPRLSPSARWCGSAPSPMAPISGTTRSSCTSTPPAPALSGLCAAGHPLRPAPSPWPRPATTWSNARSCTEPSGARSRPPFRPSCSWWARWRWWWPERWHRPQPRSGSRSTT